MNDIAKAADPSFEATELVAPVRWLLDVLWFIWSYVIYEPLALVADVAMEPITLTIDGVTGPINFIFGDYLKPVTDFIYKQYQLTKNSIWFIILELISYGSGATADAVSDAMQLALNGLLQFFTDIGLPIANTAEKLSQLSDQMAKSRRRRSISNAFGDLTGGIEQIIKFPFLFLQGIFSILTFPFRMIFGLVKSPFSFLFGSDEGDSTYTLLLTDMSTEKITNKVLESIWNFMKDTGFPELDAIAEKLMESQMLPEKMRSILSEFDSMYRVAKMIGYVK